MAYSEIEITEALVRLAVNKGNYELTAEQTGISSRTLKRWAKMSPKKGVPELLDRAIERMLMVIPDKWEGRDWSVAIGILMDKWLLVHGQPTSRTESIIGQLEKLSNDELDNIIHEFEAAASRGVVSGNGQGATKEAHTTTETT